MGRMISFFVLVITVLLFISCEDLLCEIEEEKKDNETIVDTIRFKPLEEPIDGTLYFFAGPTFTELDTFFIQRYPWYFWKLNGKFFYQLNSNSIPSDWWVDPYQLSPKGNYFSCYNNIINGYYKDGISVFDLNSFVETPLTNEVGSANPEYYNHYEWDINEEFIYFSAYDSGMTYLNNNGNVDIYRIRPNGNDLTKLTDQPYHELAGTPSPDGNKMAYIIEKSVDTPDSLQGYYVMNLATLESEFIKNVPYKLYTSGNVITWHPSSTYFLIKSSRISYEGFTYVNAETGHTEQIQIFNDEVYYVQNVQFIPNTNKILITRRNDYGNNWISVFGIYDLDTGEYIDLTDKFNAIILGGSAIPTVSPDGHYLAFIGSNEMPSGIYSGGDNWFYLNPDAEITTEIFIMDLSDYSIRQITNGLYGWEGYLRWVE